MSTDDTPQQDREKVKNAQQMLSMRESLPHLVQFIELQAELIRAKYKALIKQGFTEQQAIELCNGGAFK